MKRAIAPSITSLPALPPTTRKQTTHAATESILTLPVSQPSEFLTTTKKANVVKHITESKRRTDRYRLHFQ